MGRHTGIPGPSSSRSARSAALRPSPPFTMKVSSAGPSAANATKGELLVQLETLSRKCRSVKRKTPGSVEKDRPVLAKVPKLGGRGGGGGGGGLHLLRLLLSERRSGRSRLWLRHL